MANIVNTVSDHKSRVNHHWNWQTLSYVARYHHLSVKSVVYVVNVYRRWLWSTWTNWLDVNAILSYFLSGNKECRGCTIVGRRCRKYKTFLNYFFAIAIGDSIFLMTSYFDDVSRFFFFSTTTTVNRDGVGVPTTSFELMAIRNMPTTFQFFFVFVEDKKIMTSFFYWPHSPIFHDVIYSTLISHFRDIIYSQPRIRDDAITGSMPDLSGPRI